MPWLIAFLALLGYEAFALYTGHETLSRMVYEATQAWGLLPFLAGFLVGMLASHFWWRWDPDRSKKGGG